MAYEQIDPASREGQGAIFKKRCLEYLVGVYGKEKLDAPDKAEAVGKQIVDLDPKDVNNYFGMAQLYQEAGRVEEAEQMLLRAKEVAPNNVDVQLQLAGFYNKQGNFDKTMEAFQARIQLEPNNPEAYHTVAGYFEEKVRKDYTLSPAVKADYIKRGLEASTKAIEIKADYVDAMVMKNLLLRQQALVEKNPARQQELLKEADGAARQGHRDPEPPAGRVRRPGCEGQGRQEVRVGRGTGRGSTGAGASVGPRFLFAWDGQTPPQTHLFTRAKHIAGRLSAV